METLFVRIPVELKERLRRSAAARETSMGEEVTRLLTEQLEQDLSLTMKYKYLSIQSEMARSRADMLARYVEPLEMPDDALATREQHAQLLAMCKMLFKRNDAAALAKRLKEEQERRGDVGVAVTTPVRTTEAVSGVTGEVDGETQFSEPERRRRNLHAAFRRAPRGTKKALAEHLDWPAARISQLLSEPHRKGHRRVTPDIARKLEGALGLEQRALEALEPDLSQFRLIKAVEHLKSAIRGAGSLAS